MGGLEDADGLEGGDVGRLTQELAQSTARIGADERPEKLGGSGQRDAALGLIAHDGEVMADRGRGSRLVQQPTLAKPRFANEEQGGWTVIDGHGPAEGANPVELRGPTNERSAHRFRTIRRGGPRRSPSPTPGSLRRPSRRGWEARPRPT